MSETAPTDVHLPAPTGPHPVGRASYYWKGTGQDAGDPRELVVFVWYPAAPTPGARPTEYLPAGWEPVGQFWGFRADGVRSHAYADATVAADLARYPVLALSPAGFPPLSLGGNAALEFGRLDGCCKAAANLDGGTWNEVGRLGLNRPSMPIMPR